MEIYMLSHFVPGDGCIFVWRLPAEMTSTMLTRLSQMASNNPNKTRAYITPDNNEADTDGFSPNPTPVDQLMDPAAPHNQTPPAGTAGTLLNRKYLACVQVATVAAH